MKVLLINGSPNEHGCTYTALCEAADVFSKNGIETEILYLGKALAKLDSIDALIVGSPVYYAGVSGQITSFLDRLFYAGGGKMAGKPAASVVSCRRGGASAAFEILNKYFMMTNMPVVSSQYWNQVHGNTPEEVKRDLEGLQTVRTLAENMTWLLRCIEAGRRAGVPYPTYEPKLRTNFIR